MSGDYSISKPSCTLIDSSTRHMPCGREMVARKPRLGTRLPYPHIPTLFVCPVHDGAAASVYQTNPHYNRPRKDDSK